MTLIVSSGSVAAALALALDMLKKNTLRGGGGVCFFIPHPLPSGEDGVRGKAPCIGYLSFSYRSKPSSFA
jgi:hypothetical protein